MKHVWHSVGALALACLVAGGVSGPARAEVEEGPAAPGADRLESLKTELGLSDEQAEKLRAHFKGQMEQGRPLWEDLKAKREALATELKNPNLSESSVKSIGDQVKAAHAKVIDHRLNGVVGIRKILTAEQFAKWQTRIQERREERREMAGEQGKKKRQEARERREKRWENREKGNKPEPGGPPN